MIICRTSGMEHRRILAQCIPVNAITSSDIAKSLTLSSEPQKAVKALGRRLQVNLSLKDVSRAMAGVYVDLQKKGHDPVMATYIRDLYGIGEAERYFDQAKNIFLVVDANGRPIKVASADTVRYRLGRMSYRYHKSFRKDSSSGKRDKKMPLAEVEYWEVVIDIMLILATRLIWLAVQNLHLSLQNFRLQKKKPKLLLMRHRKQ